MRRQKDHPVSRPIWEKPMKNFESAPHPPGDEGEVRASTKKKVWTKPTVRPLYQIEGVSSHPTFDPDKVGELGTIYRGTS